jgi:hypothetical protein
MDIAAIEKNIWRTWKENDTGNQYIFLPGGNGLTTSHHSTYRIEYNVYEEKGKHMLKINNSEIYHLKVIEGSIHPAIMIWIDRLGGELYFTSR